MKAFTLLSILVLTSCTTKYSPQVQRISDELNNFSVGGKEKRMLIITSDSLEIHNSGNSPAYYEEQYGEEVIAIVDEDIIFIDYYGGNRTISVVGRSSFDASVNNPNNLLFYKGDTLFLVKKDMGVDWEIGKKLRSSS